MKSATELSADIVILTILDEEYEEVCTAINNTELIKPRNGFNNLFGWKSGFVGDYHIVVGKTTMAGTHTVQQAATDAIKHFHPQALLVTGIAGSLGHKDNLKPGEIVVGDQIYFYEYGKLKHKELHIRTRQALANPAIFNAVNHVSQSIPWCPDVPDAQKPRVITGGIACGEKIVDTLSHPLAQDIVAACDGMAKAVEMESWGCAAAVTHAQSDLKNITFGVIRGISDVPTVAANTDMTLPVDASAASTAEADANAGMRDDNKRLAARRAAQFTVALIREAWPYSPKKLWRYRAWWLAAALIVMAALAAAYFWYVPILELRKAQNEYDHDNRDGARKLLEANPQRWSNNAAAQFLLGVIAARDGESLRALEYYEKAARLDSSAPQYKGNLAATRLRIDDSATARKDAQRVFSEILDGNQPFLLAAAEWLRLELVRDGGPDWKAIEARMATGNRWLDETAMNQPWNLHYWRFPDGSGELQRLYYNGDRQQPRDDRQCYWFGLQQLAKYLRDSSMPLFWPPACTESEPARAVLAADILRIYKAHPQWQTRLRAAAAGLELPTGPDI